VPYASEASLHQEQNPHHLHEFLYSKDHMPGLMDDPSMGVSIIAKFFK
jgi:hypothetical protein